MKNKQFLIASNLILLLASMSIMSMANAFAWTTKNGKIIGEVEDCHNDTNRYKDKTGWHDAGYGVKLHGCSRAIYNPNANSTVKKGIDSAKLEKVKKPKAVKKLPKEAKKENTQKAVKSKKLSPKTSRQTVPSIKRGWDLQTNKQM